MKKSLKIIAFIIGILLMTACSSTNHTQSKTDEQNQKFLKTVHERTMDRLSVVK